MTTKHTPGPWTFSTSPEGWSNTIHVAQADGAPYTDGYSDVGYIIQTCQGEDESTQMANARLIAAAPEMLEALKLAMQIGDGCSRGFLGKVQTQIQAAISKATGAA